MIHECELPEMPDEQHAAAFANSVVDGVCMFREEDVHVEAARSTGLPSMGELVEYRSAARLASVYRASVGRLMELVVEIGTECAKLKAAFQDDYAFGVDVYFNGSQHHANVQAAEYLEDRMRRAAWGVLINKLGIRKIMSSKRQEELDREIHGERRWEPATATQLPKISEETIYEVLAGMIQSADEFMSEAIHEEYDFWRPSRHCADYVRNSDFKLNRKIIRPWMVERGWPGEYWRPTHGREKHITALDNIFHRLDGKGMPETHYGPLGSAIRTCGPDGKGRTDYFAFRCFKNQNLHLEFLRPDMLERFNLLAGRNRLPSPDE